MVNQCTHAPAHSSQLTEYSTCLKKGEHTIQYTRCVAPFGQSVIDEISHCFVFSSILLLLCECECLKLIAIAMHTGKRMDGSIFMIVIFDNSNKTPHDTPIELNITAVAAARFTLFLRQTSKIKFLPCSLNKNGYYACVYEAQNMATIN